MSALETLDSMDSAFQVMDRLVTRLLTENAQLRTENERLRKFIARRDERGGQDE